MTMIDEIEIKCSVCGKSSPQPVLLSTNTMGYPDLDLRPPEMQRSTMNTWICECSHCGYVAPNIEEELEISKDYLQSEEYLSCDGYEFRGYLSRLFFKHYLISKQKNDISACFLSLRNCAWDCDDHSDENAAAVRKLALPYIDNMIENDDEAGENLLVIKSDFLRRSGEFQKLIDEYETLLLDDELLDRIIQFEIQKARENDTDCYTVEDVVGQ